MDEARLQRWLNGQRRSHQRTFQSREMVWSTFEGLSRDQGASIDQLIGEAMEAYAEQRGYHIAEEPVSEENRWASPEMHDREEETKDPLEETHDAPGLTDLDRSYIPPAPAPTPRRAPSFNSSSGWEDNDLARTETREAVQRRAPPPLDVREPGEESRTAPRFPRGGSSNVPTMPIPAAISRPVPTPAAGSLPPRGPRPIQPPAGGGAMPATMQSRAVAPPPQAAPPQLRDTGSNPSLKRLMLFHQGQTVEVTKDRFLLGRSKTQADLRLDDPNVSRQHAAIERVGAAWFIVDLGSTNGIYVSGQKVARRALADGDLIVITSHEIRCTLR